MYQLFPSLTLLLNSPLLLLLSLSLFPLHLFFVSPSLPPSHTQLVTDHLLRIYHELEGLVSPDNSHQRYQQDVRLIHQSPIVPDLGENLYTNGHNIQ